MRENEENVGRGRLWLVHYGVGILLVQSKCQRAWEGRFRVETSGQFPLDTKLMCAMTLLPLFLLSIT